MKLPGRVQLELVHGMQGAPVTYDGVCLPAATAAAKCMVSEAETRITAGQPASLRVTRFDRCAVQKHECGLTALRPPALTWSNLFKGPNVNHLQ
jgi:hypothetical protein